jgi:hypothetical protein
MSAPATATQTANCHCYVAGNIEVAVITVCLCLELTRGGAPSWGLCEGLTVLPCKRFAPCRMFLLATELAGWCTLQV